MSIGRIATAAIAAALLAGSGWGMAIWTPKAICEASGMYGGDNNRYSKAADPFIAVLVGSPTALRVRLWVEGLDASGHVMNSRDAEVRGEVPSNGNAFFCVPVKAGAETYRVTVTGADWMYDSRH